MNKSEILALQMEKIGRSGNAFFSSLHSLDENQLDSEFITDGFHLEDQIRGKPGSGAIDSIRSVADDLAATDSFLNRWQDYYERTGYTIVLTTAKMMLEDLTHFRDMVESLTPSELRQVETDARLGRLMLGKGCSLIFVTIVFLGITTVLVSWLHF